MGHTDFFAQPNQLWDQNCWGVAAAVESVQDSRNSEGNPQLHVMLPENSNRLPQWVRTGSKSTWFMMGFGNIIGL
jgi:hypothetical protein